MSGQISGIYKSTVGKTSNGVTPATSQMYSFSVALVSGAATVLDLKPLANLHRIQNLQGIFIDNTGGSTILDIATQFGPTVQIPAGYQAVMPLYLTADQVLTVTGNGTINFTLLNFPTPIEIWSPAGAGTVTVSGTVQVQDSLAESLLATIQNQITPSSGSVASSAVATSTTLFAANAARQYVMIQSAYKVATGVFTDLWVNMLGGVAGVGLVDCIRIPAGQAYESGSKVTISAITYFDAVGTNEITAYQG